MADKSSGELQLRGLVLALGLRAAATAGALVALVALLSRVPLRAACLRGGATWLALVALAKATQWLVARTYGGDRARSEPASAENGRRT
jgi:hypothetical protein